MTAHRALGLRLGRYAAVAALLVSPVAGISSLLTWLTRPAPIGLDAVAPEPRVVAGEASFTTRTEPAGGDSVPAAPPQRGPLAWPRLPERDGLAKQVLLEFLRESRLRMDRVSDYTAILRRQERLKGKMGPEQRLVLKVRHDPFSVYLKFLAPNPGKEALFVQGERENKVLAHNGDWTRKLIPLLEVPPTSPIAMIDNRHPITEAGLSNLIDRLLYFRELDLTDPKGSLTLDRVQEADGREWYRSVTVMDHDDGVRPFARVEVLYCPERRLPLRIQNFGWPEQGSASKEPLLVESYAYDELVLNPGLSASDFDPANPSYAFNLR